MSTRQRYLLALGVGIVIALAIVLAAATRTGGQEPPPDDHPTCEEHPEPYEGDLPCGFVDGIPPGCYATPADPDPCDEPDPDVTCDDDGACVLTEDLAEPYACDPAAGHTRACPAEPAPVEHVTFTG